MPQFYCLPAAFRQHPIFKQNLPMIHPGFFSQILEICGNSLRYWKIERVSVTSSFPEVLASVPNLQCLFLDRIECPPPPKSATVSLPSLHTLVLDGIYCIEIFQWSVPALRHLIMRNTPGDEGELPFGEIPASLSMLDIGGWANFGDSGTGILASSANLEVVTMTFEALLCVANFPTTLPLLWHFFLDFEDIDLWKKAIGST
jgi:hypothetical protein